MSPFKLINMMIPQKPPVCNVVIAAAGSSQRCNGEDKLLYKINGKPVLAYTIEAFEKCTRVREIVIVTAGDKPDAIAGICKEYDFKKVSKILIGGKTRTESVYIGVFGVSDKPGLIAIHDGARPCISPELIEKTLDKAAKYHAAAPAIPVSSTIKKVDKSASRDFGMTVSETVDRASLVEIQTPQIFRSEIIRAGLENAVKKNIPLTDDCMAAELIGAPVHVVEGDKRNIKITECVDLQIAEALLCRG